ncbi:MAG TPA: polysaccharide biosynthesis tyrosine autokinase [Chitinophagaceae bacterium]|nr:polysaccharide biosynthesis tyrosine autokinase [Chitinophagaceae bacterium]
MEEQQQQLINSNKSELWNLSLKDLFYKYVRFLPLFLLSVAIALLLAFAYLRYTTRIYSSTGAMLIKYEQQSNRSDKIEDILKGGNETQNIQNEIEVLKSKPLMERVVKKLNLQFSYTAKGRFIVNNIYKQGPFIAQAFKIADSSGGFSMDIKFINDHQFRVNNESATFALGDLFENGHGVFSLIKRAPAITGSEYTISWQPAENIAGSLAGGVKVQPKTPGTSILTITLQSTNAHMAADIVNNLMVEYDSMTVEQNNYSNDQMLGFIDERLKNMNQELDTLQLRFLKYKQDNNLFDVDKQLTESFLKYSDADKNADLQQFKLNVAEEIDNYVKDKKNQYSTTTPSALFLEDATLTELVSLYNKVQLERQGLLDAHLPPSHPRVKAAEGQIEEIRGKLIENLNNIRLSLHSSINVLKGKGSVEQSKLEALPFKLKLYVEMDRQIKTKLELLSLLEGKREEISIQRAAITSNSKVIDKAGISNTPVKPNRKTIQILAILAGLGLPALLIFVGEILNDKINTRFDIERLTQAPILGEIGHSFADNTLIVSKTSRTMVAEQFRIIRSNLQYVVNKPDKTVILVTSSFSGEGKSFISTNMAAVLALAGKKTIILEFDIRKPKVLSGLHIGKRPGITNFLMGKANLNELITPVPDYENLSVLACGPVPPNPSEMLLDLKVSELFEEMGKRFEVIFIDTAPVGMVSDALTLSKFADCTLYLVRQGHTFKKQIALIDELYREKKLPKVSIVINDVKNKPGYGYYGYGRYGYGYGYGYGSSYYDEEKPPQTFIERILAKLNPKKWFRRFRR